jgi:hypothetical protein
MDSLFERWHLPLMHLFTEKGAGIYLATAGLIFSIGVIE